MADVAACPCRDVWVCDLFASGELARALLAAGVDRAGGPGMLARSSNCRKQPATNLPGGRFVRPVPGS